MTTNFQHDSDILDQFTRQAVPFSERHAADDELMALLVETSGVTSRDRVLDIACGPGLVSCAFAEKAAHVTGLDRVPAMLEQAKILQNKRGRSNIDWKQGSAIALPFADGEFDMVVTRFSFHHYLDPQAAILEMKRVCKPGGTVMIIDVAPRPSCRDAYDEVEKLRDPSHTRALTVTEFEELGRGSGLALGCTMTYELASDLEGLLKSSFPQGGDADKVRALFRKDIEAGGNQLGVGSHYRNRQVWFFFPVAGFVWRCRDEPRAV